LKASEADMVSIHPTQNAFRDSFWAVLQSDLRVESFPVVTCEFEGGFNLCKEAYQMYCDLIGDGENINYEDDMRGFGIPRDHADLIDVCRVFGNNCYGQPLTISNIPLLYRDFWEVKDRDGVVEWISINYDSYRMHKITEILNGHGIGDEKVAAMSHFIATDKKLQIKPDPDFHVHSRDWIHFDRRRAFNRWMDE
jgi:hypothetical protein